MITYSLYTSITDCNWKLLTAININLYVFVAMYMKLFMINLPKYFYDILNIKKWVFTRNLHI